VDSAAGFGSSDEAGQMLGSQGDIEVFSFHATKTFCVGEGGLIASTQAHTRERLAELSNFGMNEDRVVDVQSGINAKMSEWTAATALARLDSFEAIVAERQRYARKLIDSAHAAHFSSQPNLETSSVQFVPLMAPSESAKLKLLSRAAELGVEVKSYFNPPLHQMNAFVSLGAAGPLEVTEEVSRRVVSLPMADHFSDQELRRIAQVFE
jgi:dTDP-4-amino-4,6-dideoxygalactose transaminase